MYFCVCDGCLSVWSMYVGRVDLSVAGSMYVGRVDLSLAGSTYIWQMSVRSWHVSMCFVAVYQQQSM